MPPTHMLLMVNAALKRSRSALLLLASASALLLAGCGGDASDASAASAGAGTPQSSGPYATPEAAAEAQARQQALDLAELGFNEGDEENAPVRVVEFSDFGCIYCASFHIETYHALHDEFIASGDIIWKYVPITIGGFPNGDQAALAGECAGAQGRFARMRDHIFENREEWLGSSDADALFARYAQNMGLDMTEFAACYQGEEAAGRIDRGNRIAAQLGVRGTPTFIIQGFPVSGAPPLDVFQGALREVLAEVRGGNPDGE